MTLNKLLYIVTIAIFNVFIILSPSFAGEVNLPGGAKITIPSGYTQSKSDDEINLSRENPFTEISIISENMEMEVPVDFAGKEFAKELESSGAMKINKSEKTIINGREFYVIHGTVTEEGITVSMTAYICSIKTYMYCITCGCFNKDIEKLSKEFRQIVGSIKR